MLSNWKMIDAMFHFSGLVVPSCRFFLHLSLGKTSSTVVDPWSSGQVREGGDPEFPKETRRLRRLVIHEVTSTSDVTFKSAGAAVLVSSEAVDGAVIWAKFSLNNK